MIFHIAKHRFLANIMTFRFSASFILSVLLFAASTVILSRDYSERLIEYRDFIQQCDNGLNEIYTFARLRVGIARPPTPLSIVCEGLEKRTASWFAVGFDRAPRVAQETDVSNPLLRVFTVFDLATIVEVVLSLLAILVAYNAISGEREQGRLKLILSNRVPRHSVLLGNYVGSMATIVLPLLVGSAISLLIIQLNPSIELSANDYLSLVIMFMVAVLFLGVFFLTGMFLSVRIMRSSTSLILLLVFWVVIVLIIPNSAVYLARHLEPIPDKATIDSQAQTLLDEWVGDMHRYTDRHPRPWTDVTAGMSQDDIVFLGSLERGRSQYTGSWPYAYSVFYSIREMMEWFETGSVYGHNLRMDYENRIWALYQDYQFKLEKQTGIARIISLISPSWAFYHATSYLTDTNEAGYLHFIDQASQYRNELIAYMKSRGGLDSYLLFTQKPIDQFLSAREALALRDSRGAQAVMELVNYPLAPLDLSDLPSFNYAGLKPVSLMREAFPEILVLVFLNLLFFTLSWVSFQRADVR